MLVPFHCFRRITVSAGLLALVVAPALLAAPPSKPEERAALVGKPAALLVQPTAVTLSGPRATQQLVVTGKYADGSLRDLTPFAAVRIEQPGMVDLNATWLKATANGTSALLVEAGGQTVRVPLTVKDFDKSTPVSFRHEV